MSTNHVKIIERKLRRYSIDPILTVYKLERLWLHECVAPLTVLTIDQLEQKNNCNYIDSSVRKIPYNNIFVLHNYSDVKSWNGLESVNVILERPVSIR